MKVLILVEVEPDRGWVQGIHSDFGGPVLFRHGDNCPKDGLHHEEQDDVVAYQPDIIVDAVRDELNQMHYADPDSGWRIKSVRQAVAP